MIPESTDLIEAFTADLPEFLAGRLDALGVADPTLDGVIDRIVAEVRGGLESLLGRSFDRQQEAPLEVVRRAIAPLGGAVSDLAVAPVERDEEQQRIAPDDVYGFAPASAAELGESSLQASLRWGLAKTAALRRPLLLVVTANLMDASRFEPAAATAGYRMEARRSAEPSVAPVVAFVDLESDDADDAIRSLSDRGVRVVAYGPHVDDHAMVRAMALGASVAEPRSRMFRSPGQYLPPLV